MVNGQQIQTDALAVAEELRLALTRSQLTQTAFAAALGTSQPRLSTYLSSKVSPSAEFFVRAQRLGQALEGLRCLHLLSAPTLGLALRTTLNDGDRGWAFRLLMQGRDHLRLVLDSHPDLIAGWLATPLSTGLEEWDTLTAVVAGHEFSSAGLDAPPWTQRKALATPWVVASRLLAPQEVRAATPTWLAALNIFVPERDLATV